jgi:hypothetical protein
MQELNSTPSNAPLRQSVSTLKKKTITSGYHELFKLDHVLILCFDKKILK